MKTLGPVSTWLILNWPQTLLWRTLHCSRICSMRLGANWVTLALRQQLWDLHKKLPTFLGFQFRNSSTFTFLLFICFIPLTCTLYHSPCTALVQMVTWLQTIYLGSDQLTWDFFPLLTLPPICHCKLRQEVHTPKELPSTQREMTQKIDWAIDYWLFQASHNMYIQNIIVSST